MSKSIKITNKDSFIPIQLLNNIIESTTVPEQTVDEADSELFFTTLHGYGRIKFKNGNEYEGNVKFGILNSLTNIASTLKFKDGTIYSGEIVNNKITGSGRYDFANRSSYIGLVENGLRHGKGKYENLEEDIVYEGEWKYGLKHGEGKLKIKDMFYEGMFYEGSKHKFGKLKWKDTGNYYEGEFYENDIYGNGYMIWVDNNEKYIGKWKCNQQNGMGVHIWYEPKGEYKYLKNRYVGEWENGQRQGYGVFFYANGSKYEGLWDKNIKNGFGIFTFQDGTQYIGRFINDRMVEHNMQGQVQDLNKRLLTNESFKNQNQSNQSKAKKDKKFGTIYEDPKENKLTNVNTSTNLNKNNKSVSNTDNESQASKNKKSLAPLVLDREKSSLNISSSTSNANIRQPKYTSNNPAGQDTIVESVNEELEEEFNIPKQKVDHVIANRILKESDSNPFSTMIDIADILEIEPEIEKSLQDIQSLLLRYLSDIKAWYKVYTNLKENEKMNEQDNKREESKNIRKTSKLSKDSFNNLKGKDDQIITEGLNLNTDIGNAMDMKDLWRFIRESGVLNAEFSLADFNRLYFNGPRNFIEMYTIPEDIKDNQFYQYLFTMINVGKKHFLSKYKRNDTYGNFTNAGKVPVLEYKLEDETFQFDIHSKRNIVLLRQFYESIVRIAYIRIMNEPLVIKIKLLVENYIKQNPRLKSITKRTSIIGNNNTSSFIGNNTDEQVKILPSDLLNDIVFSNSYETELYCVFKEIYRKSRINNKKCDLSIRYRFIYESIIKKDKELSEMIDKYLFISFIHKHHLNRCVINEDNKYTVPVISYIENLLDSEMIFYEFCELIVFISRLYVSKLNTQEKKELLCPIIDNVIQIMKRCDYAFKSIEKYKYYYPALDYHRRLDIQIKQLKRQREEERKQEAEKQRWKYENECMFKQGSNLIKINFDESEDNEEEEEEGDEL